MKGKAISLLLWLQNMKQSVIEKKAPFSQKLVYAFGEFPGAAVTSIINLLLLIYLTDFIRISPFWAGAIMFVGFIWDGLTDPYFGYLSDNSHSRLGRRKSFMIKYMIPFAVFFIALFSVPTLFRENAEIIRVLMVLLVYMIYILVYTLVCIPYNTVISDMTDDYDERTSFTTWRMTVSIMPPCFRLSYPRSWACRPSTREAA
jgi:Na+/melibiose symporter-like transporter